MGWRTRFVLFILCVFLVFVGYVVWIIASTGLVVIPVVSSWAYEKPQPTRFVGEGVPFGTIAVAQANNSFVSVPETTLTTELRDSIETNGQRFFDADRSQVAVIPNAGIELYLPVADNASGTAILALLELSVESGVPKISVHSASVGSWNMPGWMRDKLAGPAMQSLLDKLVEQGGGSFPIESLRLEQGMLIIKLPNA